MDRAEPRLLGTATGQQAWRSERAELKAGLLAAERCDLATTHLDSLAPSIEDLGTNPAVFSCFVLIYDDLRQPIPAPGIVAIGTTVANNSWCAVPQQSLWPAGAFSCDCMFQDERGGGLTRQPVGPSVDTAIMTVLSTNRVDSRSFSSRDCAFRRTHTSRPYSATLYPTSFTLDSLLALTIRPQLKTHGWCFTSGPMAVGGFFVRFGCTFWD